MTTPFSTVTYFEKDLPANVLAKNFTELCSALDAQIPSKNHFYAIRIEGNFPYVKTRSIPKQSRPYPLLKDLVLNSSDVFLDVTPEFNMVIPTIGDFIDIDLTKDLQEDLKQVEQ
jgi:alpha-acetolactate decarboxylase